MPDLKNPKLIYLKGFLFLFAAILASILILIDHPELKTAFLLAIAIFSAARFYYFTLYVIEKYVEPKYKFAGLSSFIAYLIKNKK